MNKIVILAVALLVSVTALAEYREGHHRIKDGQTHRNMQRHENMIMQQEQELKNCKTQECVKEVQKRMKMHNKGLRINRGLDSPEHRYGH